MAENSRQSKLSEKDEECVFTWKVFTGWDYMIGNAETAHNRTASIILGFKEALLEEAEKKRDEGRNWKVTSLRVFAHINVLWLLGSSVYAVILVVDRSTQPEAEHGWWRKNEITIVVSLITSLFPTFFEGLGIIEQYHPRKKLRMQLARIMALNLLNIYTLIFASFSKINEMSNTLEALRPRNSSYIVNVYSQGQSGTNHSGPSPSCRNITVPCPSISSAAATSVILSLLSSNNNTETVSNNLMNFSTTISLNFSSSINESSTYSSLTDFDLETLSSYESYPYSIETTTSDVKLPIENLFVELSENLENLDSNEYLKVDNDTLANNGIVNTTVYFTSEMYEINQKEINSTNPTLIDNFTVAENYSTVKEITPLENITHYDNLTTYSGQNFDEVHNGSDLPLSSTTQIPYSTNICFKTICDDLTELKATNNQLNPSPASQSISNIHTYI